MQLHTKIPASIRLGQELFPRQYRTYTKSVQWPTQGVFVGDPLARPYGTKATLSNGTLTVTTTSLVPGTNYTLYSAPSATGPFSQIATVSVPNNQFATITVPGMSAPFYKLEKSINEKFQ